MSLAMALIDLFGSLPIMALISLTNLGVLSLLEGSVRLNYTFVVMFTPFLLIYHHHHHHHVMLLAQIP